MFSYNLRTAIVNKDTIISNADLEKICASTDMNITRLKEVLIKKLGSSCYHYEPNTKYANYFENNTFIVNGKFSNSFLCYIIYTIYRNYEVEVLNLVYDKV